MKVLRPRVATIDTRTARPPAKDVEPFYQSAKWLELMAAIIQVRGRRCEDPQCRTPRGPWSRVYGDHIVELRDGGAALDPANVLLRCSPCHGRKTAKARAARTAAPAAAAHHPGGHPISTGIGAPDRVGAHAEILGSSRAGNRDSLKGDPSRPGRN